MFDVVWGKCLYAGDLMANKKKFVFTIGSALILGAFGSGLWSDIFSPMTSMAGHWLLTLYTLGMESARDSIYKRASLGFYERPSATVLFAFGVAILYFAIGISSLTFFYATLKRWVLEKKNAESMRVKILRRFNKWMSIVLIFTASFLFVQISLMVYADTVIARFNQTLAIVSPYISADQHTIFLARFASIKTRNDFISLFEELNKIAEKNGQARSEFHPW